MACLLLNLSMSQACQSAGFPRGRYGAGAAGFAGLNFLPVGASASSSWKIDRRNAINLALTRSQRAPQVQELLVHGYHDATRSFELGNINLHEETSYNLDVGYKFTSDWVRAELDLFHNWVGDYIYQQRNGQFVDADGSSCPVAVPCAPVVESRQADAVFMGYESKLIFH